MSHLPKSPLSVPTAGLIERLAGIVGAENALTDPALQVPYLHEWRDRYVGRTPVVLRPGSTQEVSRILALCNEAGVGIVPQAGNTGLVGGQIPSADGDQIVVSVARMNRIRATDPSGTSVTVEAGVTLADVRAAADALGRLFPLSMASEGSCRIGGNLATNAGGVAVIAYGTMRHLTLGIEVVLADGQVLDGLKPLAKDNTGYDLRDLFIGSEGTLGVITAATLKLVPKPREKATAFAGVARLKQLLLFLRLAQEMAGPHLTAFEFMSARALEYVLRHEPGARAPLSGSYPWLVLLEVSVAEEGSAAPLLERMLDAAIEKGLASDAVVANSLTQSRDLWRLREAMSDVQKHEGGSIKHDISVPIAVIPLFIARADALIEQLCPGARPVPFGHFGDGNIHYNVSQPAGMDKARFLGMWCEIADAVHALVTELGGSISAEHGIGQMKREGLRLAKSALEIDLMRRIKAAFDPKGILNPGKLL